MRMLPSLCIILRLPLAKYRAMGIERGFGEWSLWRGYLLVSVTSSATTAADMARAEALQRTESMLLQ